MWQTGIYKSVPELWLKKQSLKKQYDVMSFLQRLRLWEHRREPYIGDLTWPTRHGKARHLDYMAKQVKSTFYLFHMLILELDFTIFLFT